MNWSYKILAIILCTWFVPYGLSAQEIVIEEGDSVELFINDFRGDIKWQQSLNNELWENIENGDQSTLWLKQSRYQTWYRAIIQEEGCDPIYSMVNKISLQVDGSKVSSYSGLVDFDVDDRFTLVSIYDETKPRSDGSFTIFNDKNNLAPILILTEDDQILAAGYPGENINAYSTAKFIVGLFTWLELIDLPHDQVINEIALLDPFNTLVESVNKSIENNIPLLTNEKVLVELANLQEEIFEPDQSGGRVLKNFDSIVKVEAESDTLTISNDGLIANYYAVGIYQGNVLIPGNMPVLRGNAYGVPSIEKLLNIFNAPASDLIITKSEPLNLKLVPGTYDLRLKSGKIFIEGDEVSLLGFEKNMLVITNSFMKATLSAIRVEEANLIGICLKELAIEIYSVLEQRYLADQLVIEPSSIMNNIKGVIDASLDAFYNKCYDKSIPKLVKVITGATSDLNAIGNSYYGGKTLGDWAYYDGEFNHCINVIENKIYNCDDQFKLEKLNLLESFSFYPNDTSNLIVKVTFDDHKPAEGISIEWQDNNGVVVQNKTNSNGVSILNYQFQNTDTVIVSASATINSIDLGQVIFKAFNCNFSTLSATIEPLGEDIIINSMGGIPPYNYSIDGKNFQSSNIFKGYEEGDYSFIVRDDIGCEFELDFSFRGCLDTLIIDTPSDINNVVSLPPGESIILSISEPYNEKAAVKWEYALYSSGGPWLPIQDSTYDDFEYFPVNNFQFVRCHYILEGCRDLYSDPIRVLIDQTSYLEVLEVPDKVMHSSREEIQMKVRTRSSINNKILPDVPVIWRVNESGRENPDIPKEYVGPVLGLIDTTNSEGISTFNFKLPSKGIIYQYYVVSFHTNTNSQNVAILMSYYLKPSFYSSYPVNGEISVIVNNQTLKWNIVDGEISDKSIGRLVDLPKGSHSITLVTNLTKPAEYQYDPRINISVTIGDNNFVDNALRNYKPSLNDSYTYSIEIK